VRGAGSISVGRVARTAATLLAIGGCRGTVPKGAVTWEIAGHNPRPPPVVRVSIGGRTVLALVDTGASFSLLDAHGARRLGITAATGSTAVAQGLGASTPIRSATLDRLEFGAIRLEQISVGVAGPDVYVGPHGWLGGRRVEMALGMDVLSRCGAMTWDGPAMRIVFGSVGAGGTPVPMRSEHWPLPVVPAHVVMWRCRRCSTPAASSGYGCPVPLRGRRAFRRRRSTPGR